MVAVVLPQSRCLCGLLNGNLGIVKAMISEITDSDSNNMVQAFALQPIVRAVGTTAGYGANVRIELS